MTRYSEPMMKCDHGEGDCDTTSPDWYEQAADDSITVIADESGIFFEFRGTTGITGAGGRE